MKLALKTTAMGVLAGMLSAVAAPALAQTAGDIATSLAGQTGQVADLVSIVAFVLGVGMAIAGLMKFRANAQNPNDPSNKMSTAFILMFVGAGLVAVPAVLGSGIATIFNDGAQQTDANSGFRSVN